MTNKDRAKILIDTINTWGGSSSEQVNHIALFLDRWNIPRAEIENVKQALERGIQVIENSKEIKKPDELTYVLRDSLGIVKRWLK